METNTAGSAKTIVLSFLEALNRDDFHKARNYVSEDFSFVGVLGMRNSSEAYFKDMERMRLKYDIKKVFVDKDDVCVFYDIDMSGTTVFSCGWYTVKDQTIESLRVIFDPRPVLEAQQKS